jgi:hypothetical protein
MSFHCRGQPALVLGFRQHVAAASLAAKPVTLGVWLVLDCVLVKREGTPDGILSDQEGL